MEQIIFYLFIFIIGTVFGSFFTLAVYRIPLHQDITHKRSYCPKCSHKLSFWDMIPVFSYIFLGGKCRYCKEKIRVRYLLLEILTGVVFLLFTMSINISFKILETNKLVYLLFGFLYIIGMIIIAGIDKEKMTITKGVLIYEIIVVTVYIVYLYTVEKANIYRYAIYLLMLFIFIITENLYLKKKLKDNYTLQILELSMIMAIFTKEITYVATVILTLLIIVIMQIKNKIFKNKNSKSKELYYLNIPFGFYLICSNIISFIIVNFITCG